MCTNPNIKNLFFPSHLSPVPPSSNPEQQATLELLHFLLFLSTPSSHPTSVPPSSLLVFTPSTGKKSSSWFFSLKRAEANWILAAVPFSGLWLQREGGGRTGQDRGREREAGIVGGWPKKEKTAKEKKTARENCCVGHF